MSFSYTHLDNPVGSGPFTFVPTYTDQSDLIVKGYNGKYWSPLEISSVDGQTLILTENVSGLRAIRISNNKHKIDTV